MMMNGSLKFALAAMLSISALAGAFADDGHGKNHGAASAAAETPPVALTEGEVKKVDKETGKVTIKHGPIVNLDMPNMTMVFRVKEPVMLDQVKTGDKIKFAADKINGAYTVMKLDIAK